MLSRILAGIDESPGARDAAALGETLAQVAGADLLLVAAYPDPLLPLPLTIGRDVHRVRDAHALLAAVRPVDAPHAHTKAVPDYSAARALRRTARDERADLLVLGSARNTPDGIARAGTTGRKVMHDLPCAIACATAGLHDRPRAMRQIVVGVDTTPEAHAALTFARDLAAHAGATVVAVAVADDRLPVEATPLDMIAGLTEWDALVALRRRRLAEHLRRLLDGVPGVTAEVVDGDPAQELAARAADADLLVVGSRHWGALERVAVGSTADDLCRTAPCSILIVPRPVQREPAPDAADDAGAGPARGT